MTTAKHDNFLNLDMHTHDDRCLIQVGLDSLTPAERDWLFHLFQGVKQGRDIQFGVDTLESGAPVLKFTLAAESYHAA